MATGTRPGKKRRTGTGPKPRRTSLDFLENMPTALSRSTSRDTLARTIPRRTRLSAHSGPRTHARINLDLPEGTVVRLLVLDDRNSIVDTLIDCWLPAGTHELSDLHLPDGPYKLRLETPGTWCVSGLMIG